MRRGFVAQHREQIGDARIVALLREQGRDLAAMMGLTVENMGHQRPQRIFEPLAPAHEYERGGELPVFALLMATERSYWDNFCSPRRVRREHSIETDQGWRGGGMSAARRARNCSGDITR